jgi:hypothetical protein
VPFGGGLEWLRARDPGLRAARVTPVACTGFYAQRYNLGNHAAAVYALFGDRRLTDGSFGAGLLLSAKVVLVARQGPADHNDPPGIGIDNDLTGRV